MLKPKCRHGNKVCSMCAVPSEEAWRAFNEINNLVAHTDWETRVNSIITIRLSDGHIDGVLYDSKKEAVRHCGGNEQWFAFFSFRNAPNGFASPKDAEIFLQWHRLAYDAGYRLPDPDARDGGADLIMPDMTEHLHDQLRRLRSAN